MTRRENDQCPKEKISNVQKNTFWSLVISLFGHFIFLVIIFLSFTRHAFASTISDHLHAIISGHSGPFRTLILIQDPATRRGTGGQIISAVELLMDQGEVITKKEWSKNELDRARSKSPAPTNGEALAAPDKISEDFTGSASSAPLPRAAPLQTALLATPYEISGFSQALSLSNANYFLDPTKSGALIVKLWKEQFGSSLQMVVFLSRMALADMMREETTGNPSEKKRTSEGQRIEDFLALKLEKGDFMAEIKPFVDEKHVFFFSPEQPIQALLLESQLSGEFPEQLGKNEDFLMLANLNQEENQRNVAVKEHTVLLTTVKIDGKIVNRLRIIRFFRNSSASGTSPYRSITRILIPEGAKIIKTRGIERSSLMTFQQSPFLVLSYERVLNPSDREETEIFYELPFEFDVNGVDTYRLNLSKQLGSMPMIMKWIVKIPSSMTIFERSEENPYFEFTKNKILEFTAGKKP